MNRQKRFREFCRFLGDFDRKVQKSGVSVVKRGDIRSRESFNIFQKCPRSRWLCRHTFFADIFRENEKVETIFACSNGTQIESFKQINGKKSRDTAPLSRILLGFFYTCVRFTSIRQPTTWIQMRGKKLWFGSSLIIFNRSSSASLKLFSMEIECYNFLFNTYYILCRGFCKKATWKGCLIFCAETKGRKT